MEQKKINKLKIAVVVLAVALIGAIGAIIGVYAATQQNVNTSFSVSYSIDKNIAVKVTSSYQLAGEDKVTLDEISFNVPEKSQTKTVSIPDITLTGDQPYVDFSYRFDPLSTEQNMAVAISWENLVENSENIKITATYYFMDHNNGMEMWTAYNPDTKTGSNNGAAFGTGADFPISIANGWNYIQCDYRFEIDDVNKSAYITSSADGGLHFSIQQYD